MTDWTVEMLGRDGEGCPTLPLERLTRDAVARYVQIRWPNGRRKAVANEWDLTNDEARAVCEGTASATTIDKIWKHKRGGWRVILPVLGAVVGQSLDDFLAAEMEELGREHNWRAARRATLAVVESRIGAPGAVAGVGAGSTADGGGVRAGSAGLRSAELGGQGDRSTEVGRSFAPERGRR